MNEIDLLTTQAALDITFLFISFLLSFSLFHTHMRLVRWGCF